MEAKLKSIIKRTPWSLLLKAVFLAALWSVGKASLVLGSPWAFGLFLLAAVYFYFRPLFRPGPLLPGFLLSLILSALFPPGFFPAAGVGAVFFLLFGIKDLVLVNRPRAYEILVYILFFGYAATAFYGTLNWTGPGFVLAPLWIALVFMLLTRLLPWEEGKSSGYIIPLLGGFLSGEAALVLFFLPLDFVYQAAILFLFLVLLANLGEEMHKRTLSPRRVLVGFLPFALLAGLILVLNSWTI